MSYDRLYWDTRRKKTLNKRARYNVVFGETAQEPSDDYRRFTVCGFDSLPLLGAMRTALPVGLGPRADGLQAEGNMYYQQGSGIGFHGDNVRKTVICLSLGTPSRLRYQWRLPGTSEHAHSPVDVGVGHGDLYVMSEKATGYDWRLRSRVRVVHAAGHAKYIGKD